MAYLVIDQLTKIFKGPGEEEIRAVKDLSLSVEEKEMLALVGPSGCGKTTTLRLIAGLEKPSSGSILIAGRSQLDLLPQERNVAMIFQHHALYPHLSARENIAFGLKLRKLPRAEVEKRVGEASQMLSLNGCLDRKPAELSGGEQQRVAIARALVRRPKVFLLDEPLSHLDGPLRARMRLEIRRVQRQTGAAMIYVTHDQMEAMAIGDRIAVMERGVLQQLDVPRNVYLHPANLFTAQFVGTPSMNVIRGRLNAESGRLSFQGFSGNGAMPQTVSLSFTDPVSPAVSSYAGKEIIMGIRPEYVRLSPTPGSTGEKTEAQVDLVEITGLDAYVFLSCGAQQLVARDDGAQSPPVGQRMFVEFKLEGAIFFDPQSGKAIS